MKPNHYLKNAERLAKLEPQLSPHGKMKAVTPVPVEEPSNALVGGVTTGASLINTANLPNLGGAMPASLGGTIMPNTSIGVGGIQNAIGNAIGNTIGQSVNTAPGGIPLGLMNSTSSSSTAQMSNLMNNMVGNSTPPTPQQGPPPSVSQTPPAPQALYTFADINTSSMNTIAARIVINDQVREAATRGRFHQSHNIVNLAIGANA